jgi:hypothetical protein
MPEIPAPMMMASYATTWSWAGRGTAICVSGIVFFSVRNEGVRLIKDWIFKSHFSVGPMAAQPPVVPENGAWIAHQFNAVQ